MRNLFIYILKYHFFLLFLILEIFCFYLIVQNNYFQKAKYINSSSVLTGYVYANYNGITDYFGLRKKNLELSVENAKLKTMHKSSFYALDKKVYSTNDTAYKQVYNYVSAKVINNSVNKLSNYITLNKGSKDGIKPDMAVICDQGIVGIVKDVTENYSSVISFLNKEVKISARIKKSGGFGTLYWDGKDREIAQLKEISNHVKIAYGDTVVTSGYSKMFPAGIKVGTIISFRNPPTDNFYRIYVKLSTDFSNLNYVYVVNNIMSDELDKLEKKQKND